MERRVPPASDPIGVISTVRENRIVVEVLSYAGATAPATWRAAGQRSLRDPDGAIPLDIY
jgi:hypothetical protein